MLLGPTNRLRPTPAVQIIGQKANHGLNSFLALEVADILLQFCLSLLKCRIRKPLAREFIASVSTRTEVT